MEQALHSLFMYGPDLGFLDPIESEIYQAYAEKHVKESAHKHLAV